MKGEAQFQTGEVWEEGLRRRMPNPLDTCPRYGRLLGRLE